MNKEIFRRSSTTIPIATFWENYQLNKYNFNPSYQRRGNVWNENKRSFLIDTIFKNFPMPPIFLYQKIDENGKTLYEVIDGKQRLETIISFLRNEITVPNTFADDAFGWSDIAGKNFKDLESAEKSIFWRYELSLEFIDTEDDNVITNVFDRLNRNGEPLNQQELRNARYHSSIFYKLADEMSNMNVWKDILESFSVNRMEDVGFIAELLFVLLKDEIQDASTIENTEKLYKEYCVEAPPFNKDDVRNRFERITNRFKELDINFKELKINSSSHIYSSWTFAYYLDKNNVTQKFHDRLEEFYSDFRSNGDDENMKKYKASILSNTKSSSMRKKRVKALLNYCGLSEFADLVR